MNAIFVPFDGEGHGVAELTWGQRRIWAATRVSGLSINMGGAVRVPPGTTVADVAASVRFLVERHQSLRTRLEVAADSEPRQVVVARGELPLEVVDAGERDPDAVAKAVQQRYQSTNFFRDQPWPVRNAVIVQNGAVTHAVAMYSQLAIDAYSLDALVADVARMDPATGEATAPPPQLQPLELARRQGEPAALRVSRAAMRHWERILRDMPPRQFGAERADPRQPRYWELGYNSPAAHQAARIVAARNQTDSGAVLLAAFAVALAATTGINPVMTGLLVSNRFRPGLADIISPLAQIGPCVIDADVAGGTFDDVVQRAKRGMIGAGVNAYYDPRQLDALVAAISADRGEQVELSCVFNDRRRAGREVTGPLPTAEQVRSALPLSAERLVAKLDRPNRKLFVHVNDVSDTVDVVMRGDTHYLSPEQLSACLRGMEAVIVEAAVADAIREARSR